ncbi:hypothetical protein TNCV_826501 [Trichonephila clavipes]|nr:hypothetical protein TNCV_826501 [Trichonephila clavipes]
MIDGSSGRGKALTTPRKPFNHARVITDREYRHISRMEVQHRSVFAVEMIAFVGTDVTHYTRAFGNDHVLLNYGQVTWTTPELAPSSPNYHTTPT